MTRRRWIADEVSGTHARITGDHARHLSRVLRARAGQEFDIVAEGVLRRGRIIEVTDASVEFELGSEFHTSASANLILLLAIFKFDRMEWAIEKCTELGVSRIIPLIARRTDAHLAAAAAKRVERWRRIAHEAAEQSRRVSVPQIFTPIKLKDALSQGTGLHIVLSELENSVQLREVAGLDSADEITFATGPEGGWAEDELRLFRESAWASASLGPTILRAETAAIAATVILRSQFSASDQK